MCALLVASACAREGEASTQGTKANSPEDAQALAPAEAPSQGTPATDPGSIEAQDMPADEAAAEPEPRPDPQSDPQRFAKPDAWTQNQLDRLRPRWDKVLDAPATYRFQLLVTEILPGPRDEQGETPLEFREHAYREDAEYIYPASAIKTFASLAALRELASLRKTHGRSISLDTPMAFCSGRSTRCGRREDSSNLESGVITLGHEIRKMQLVSNNGAFNRLVQFAGLDGTAAHLRALGFGGVRVRHPLWTSSDPEDAGLSAQVELRAPKKKKITIAARERQTELPATTLPGLQIGVAYLDDAQGKARVDEAMDFSAKNHVPLREFHRLAMALVGLQAPGVPDLIAGGINARDLKFLRKAMSSDPLDSTNPAYSDEKKSELRYKPMLEGVLRVRDRKRIEYVSKAGRAFGFHIENAYIRDRKTGRAFAVTFAIYVNENGVLNDDLYQYDAISRPLLKDLGEALSRGVFEEDK